MPTIDNGVEYALYALAVRYPEEFEEVKRFPCAMLANDEAKANQAKALLHGAVRSHAAVARAVALLDEYAPTAADFEDSADDSILVVWERSAAIEARGIVEALA